MKTIIATTDFSDSSLNAVNYAADMAVDLEVSLLVMHVVELPAATIAEFPVTDISFQDVSRETDLALVKKSLLSRTRNKIEIETLQVAGNLNYELKNACKQVQPFAVVMSTHAPGILDRLLFGSKTVFSSRHLEFPVVNVPEGAIYNGVKKIGLTTDFRGGYHLPVEEIKTVARTFNASIDIGFVGNTQSLPAKMEIEKTILLNRLRDFQPEIKFVNHQNIEQGIELFAKENKIDLVMMIPHKHGIFHKSLSQQVIFHLPVPAMTIHED